MLRIPIPQSIVYQKSENSEVTALQTTNVKKKSSCKSCKSCNWCSQIKMLKYFEKWNAIAAIVHLLNAVLTYALPGTNDKPFPVYESYASWTSINNTDITIDNCPIDQYVVNVNRTNESEMFLVNPRAKTKTFTLSLQLLIFSFHFLSFLFQGGIPVYSLVYNSCSLSNDQYVKDIKERGVNSWRFVEYSISATLMLVCIALVSGIDEYYALFSIVVLTSVTMILGLAVELLFDDQLIKFNVHKKQLDKLSKLNLKNASMLGGGLVLNNVSTISENNLEPFIRELKKLGKNIEKYRNNVRKVGLIVHFTGWVTMLSAYGGIIVKHYLLSIQISNVQPPWWVTFAIFAIMSLYLIFGGIQLVQIYIKQRGHPNLEAKNIQVELAYIYNSLITKTILGWVIILNLTDLTDTGEIMCAPTGNTACMPL